MVKLVNTYFALSALILNIILIIFFYNKKIDSKKYLRLLLFGIGEAIFNLVINVSLIRNGFTLELLTKISYLLQIIFLDLLFSYVYSLTSKRSILKDIICYGVSTLFITLIIVMPLKKSLVGLADTFLLIGSSFFIVMSLIYSLKYLIKDKDKANSSYLLFILFGLVLISKYINVFSNIGSYMYSLILLVIFIVFENNDIKTIKKLEKAKEKISKESKNKMQFITDLSTSIKEPLDNIVNLSEEIEKEESLDKVKESTRNIVKEVNTLEEIVSGVLDISRINTGNFEIKNELYNPKDKFLELALKMQEKMNGKDIEFSYNIDPCLPEHLCGDYLNIEKIVVNLLSNAYKYTDSGYIHFDVSAVVNNGMCRLVIFVEDTGKGIKSEDVDKLFDKLDNTDTKSTPIKGTGVGLALTKELVEMMGGKIIVHTIYGEGSKFSVVINQQVINEVGSSINPNGYNDISCSNMRVVVVDDDEVNLKVIQKLLERFSLTDVLLFNNTLSLTSKMKENYKCDFILLDTIMPNVSYEKVIKELREIPDFDIPVVALVPNFSNEEKDKYIEKGFFDVLGKPTKKEDLVELLNKIKEKANNIEDLEVGKSIVEPPAIGDVDYLKSRGVDIDKSLELLGDMEMYNDTIKDFLSEVEEKWMRIERYKLEGDMENYAIDVHSLKSDAKYLGFMKLADLSYQHELSSKAKDTNFIDKNFSILEEEFNKVLNIAKDYVERYLK